MAGSGSVHICKRIIACWAVILVSLMATAPLAQDLSRLPNVVDKVAASVVSITVEQPADAQKPGSKPQHKIGSGIILIATVASLLQGGGSVTVALADGTQMVAAGGWLGRPLKHRHLKIQPKALLNEGRFVDSDLVRRAQPVFLIGNPYGPEGSVFVGLISAKGRPANSDNPYGYFQIDANVSPSVAGGAVFDFDGNVIGMMQLIHMLANGAVPIGFALPSNIVREISQQIQGSGAVARGWLDVKLQDVTTDIAANLGLNEVSGALITEAVVGGPGAAGGLKVQVVIVAADDEKVTGARSGARVVGSMSPGANIDFKVWRNRAFETVRVRFGTFPKALPAEAGLAEEPNKAGSSSSPTAR